VSGAFGNLVLSSPKVEQAASFWPSAASDIPSLSSVIRCLIAGLVFLIALEEGVGRILVLAAVIVALADPVLGVSGERILGIGVDQLAERGLGPGIVVLRQRTVALFIERVHVLAGQRCCHALWLPLLSAVWQKGLRRSRWQCRRLFFAGLWPVPSWFGGVLAIPGASGHGGYRRIRWRPGVALPCSRRIVRREQHRGLRRQRRIERIQSLVDLLKLGRERADLRLERGDPHAKARLDPRERRRRCPAAAW